MALARKLKDMMTFRDGTAYVGEAVSVTLPKLTRKLEDYRAGGMDGTVKIDLGQEAMEMEEAYGGFMRDHILGYAGPIAGELIRFVGVYQDDGTGDLSKVEIVARGRPEEIDMGEAKVGEDTEFKVKRSLVYYKLVVDDQELVEIDVLAGKLIVNGVDRRAAIREALGI